MSGLKKSSPGRLHTLRLGAPVYAILELTHRCPARCPGCPKDLDGVEDLGLDQWKEIIDKLGSHVTELRLSGGEAANHPDFAAIIECIEKAGIPFVLLTSGLWEDSSAVMSALKNSRMLRGVSFSIHGENEQVHESFLGCAGFTRGLKNLEQCVAGGLSVQTSSVLGEFNKRHIKPILQFVFQKGSRGHTFHRYIGPIRQGISIFREDLRTLMSFIGTIREKGLPVHTDGCFPLCFYEGGFQCLAGITYCSVDPGGNVRACPFSTDSFGNLLSGDVKKIWKRKKFGQWADAPEGCSSCASVLFCLGGCRVLRERFQIRFDPLMENPISAGEKEAPPKPPVQEMDSRPQALFKMRREPFGYVLIASGEVIPVKRELKALLSAYDGKNTLGHIKEVYGDEGLQLTLLLQEKGFIRLLSPPWRSF